MQYCDNAAVLNILTRACVDFLFPVDSPAVLKCVGRRQYGCHLYPRMCASACNTDINPTQPHQISQHTTNHEQNDRCGNSTAQSQAPDDGYINVRNMLST